MFFPLPPELASLSTSELTNVLHKLTHRNNKDNNQKTTTNTFNRQRRRRRLLGDETEKEEIKKYDELTKAQMAQSSEMNPPVIPASLKNGRSFQTDVIATSQVVTGALRQAPIGVAAPRLADLSSWVRSLRNEPTANYGQTYISIPTLILLVPKFAFHCVNKVNKLGPAPNRGSLIELREKDDKG